MGCAGNYEELNFDKMDGIEKQQNIDVGKNTLASQDLSNKYELIAQYTSDFFAFVTFDINPVFTYVNPSFIKKFGYATEDLIGKSTFDFIHEDDRHRIKTEFLRYYDAKMNGVLSTDMMKNIPQLNFRFRDKSNQWHFMNSTINVVEKELLIILKDISQQRKTELELTTNKEKLSAIIQGLSIASFILGPDHRIIYWNKALEELSHISAEEVVGTLDQWRAFYPEKRPCMADVLIDGNLEEIHKWYTGKWKKSLLIDESFEAVDFFPNLGTVGKWLRFTATKIRTKNGDLVGVLETLEDISESKIAQNALHESEERFRLVSSSVSDILFELNIKSHTIQWFGDIDSRMGYENGTFPRTLDAFLNHVYPDDLDKIKADASRSIKSHQKWRGEYRIINKAGRELYWDGGGITIYDDNGDPIKVVGAVTDITEKKQVQERLLESEKKYKSIFDNANDGLISINPESKRFFNANKKMIEMLGYESEEDIQNLTIFDIHLEKDLPNILVEFERHARREISRSECIPVKRKDGSIFFASISSSQLKIANTSYLSCIFIDITERKNAEDALRRSEEKYRLVTDNASDVIWTMDLNLRFTYLSPSNERMLGYPNEKALKLPLDQILTSESIERMKQIFEAEKQLENSKDRNLSKSLTLELNEIRADGTIFPIEARMSFIRDAENNPIGIIGITRDITQRKRQEEALKRSEEKFIKAFRSSPVSICITRVSDGRFLEVNKAIEKLLGYTRDELLTKTTLELGIWVDIPESKILFDDLAKTGSVFDREYRFRSKKGNIIYTRYSGEIIDFSGEKSVLSVLVDVTEQKKAIDLLRKSEEKFFKAFESSPVAICITRMCDGKFIEVNESLVQLSGYNRADLLMKSTIELNLWCNDNDRKFIVEQLSKTGFIHNQEFPFRVKDGSQIIVRYSAELIDFSGERCVLSVISDITQQKKIERSLQESEEKYRGLVENIQDVIMVTNPEGRVSYISPACYNVLGYYPEELVGTIPELFYKEDIEKVHTKITEAMKGICGSNFEYRIHAKSGDIRWISHSWSPIFTENHQLKLVVSIVKDITESKKNEQNLKAKIEELEKYKNVTVNREIKMVELKNEINELSKKMNQKPKYPNI